MVLADINEDGWLDMVVANGGKINRVYQNSQTYPDYFPASQRIDLGVASDVTTAAVAADFDNDGDLDIAFANELSSNKLFLNTPGEDPFGAGDQEITTDADASSGLAAADLDNDGEIDLVITNTDTAAQVVLMPPAKQDSFCVCEGECGMAR